MFRVYALRRRLPLMTALSMAALLLTSSAVATSLLADTHRHTADTARPLTAHTPFALLATPVVRPSYSLKALPKPTPAPTTASPTPTPEPVVEETQEPTTEAPDPVPSHDGTRDEMQAASRDDYRGAITSSTAARAYAASQVSAEQFACLEPMWDRESGWDPTAANPSGAYGIPQSQPGSKMASAGDDWRYNAVTQINWGLSYIRSTYGSPCSAWAFWQSHNWY